MSLTLFGTFLVSLTLHAALLLFGPAVRPPALSEAGERIVEVDLVRREVPLPEALRPKPLPRVAAPEPLDVDRLLGKEGAPPPPAPALAAKPALPGPRAVPRDRPPSPPPEPALPRPAAFPDALALLPKGGAGEGGPGGPEVVEIPVGVPGRGRGPGARREVSTDKEAAERAAEELARLAGEEAAAPRRAPPVRGPAARRRIVFRPPPPKVDALKASEDITLRFWVLPDGTVGRVVPVRKGDAHLEGIASNHLKRWRFSPLPQGAPPREEWGVVAFRFRVR